MPSAASTASTWLIGNDRGLTDIERSERGDDVKCACDIGAITRRRLVAAEHAFRHDDFRRDLFDADDPQAALFEQAGDAGQEPIVAAAKDAGDARHQPDASANRGGSA